ncbi:mitogen-activated protein kinase kinase kinase 3-like [Coffea arabica]|uniref:mitogen-activated protein kinase kinase kinase n=1 Tax=Coffea arabica TaxID=13443 RepID=A0A6P6ULA7_COFAR|nr:mitogen-activated protein kinase kinase kinase 3-like [Coffea arabica]
MVCRCWSRRIQLHDEETTFSEVKNNRHKPKSFAEAIFSLQNSPRTRGDFSSYQVSFQGFSPSRVSHQMCINDKRDYPLPLPLPMSSPEPSMISIGCSSFSSVSDDDVDEHLGQNVFSSYRTHEESGPNTWSRNSYAASRTSTPCASSPKNLILCDISFEFQTEGNEHSNHPIHPLPCPPTSPTKPLGLLKSTWIKGKLLGRGTFGHVYAGFNSENGKMCAIKEVRLISDDQTSRECLRQLNQEIEVLSQLSHPNIVQYYGSQLAGDKLSVYLESVSGGSMLKLLQDYGPFGEKVIQSYTRKILCGLVYLHDRNVVHRDIKGANILVNPKGEVKLTDFGMAKHIDSCSSMLSFKGSPYWTAPEVIMDTGVYSLAVDIWSLGCVVLEMATSKPPWSQYEGISAIFRIANDLEVPEIPNNLSEEAKSFVKVCLQRNPSVRPTAAQLLHHPFIQGRQENRISKDKCC